jgi:hypothetical protein
MNINEIKYLLNDAKEALKFIEEFYQDSLNNKEVSIALQLKIKHILENIKSSLDYIAYHVFSELCSEKIDSKFEDHVRNLYFPNKRTPKEFDKYVQSMFPGLVAAQPEIVEIFRSVQSFGDITWYSDLNKLVNKNKHRFLTKQNRVQTTHIHSGKVGGLILSNVSFTNVDVPIRVDNTPIDFVNPSPYDKNFNFSLEAEFLFEDINKPVLPTLYDIHTGATYIIKAIEKVLQGE